MKNGFSLLELLIVISIIGVLTTLTYPNYIRYIIRAHRSDGQTALLDLANQMEHHYNEFGTYILSSADEPDTVLKNSPQGWYSLSVTNATASSYTLQATPINTQAFGDTDCQSLTFDSNGSKGVAAGPAGLPKLNAVDCW